MRIVRNITQANFLLSSLQSNALLVVSLDRSKWAVYTKHYSNCSCMESAACIEQSALYGTNSEVLYTILGMYIGYYIMEALLQSTLECFYTSSCLNQLVSYSNSTSRLNVTLLSASASTRFPPTSTVGDLLNELMVEE